MGDYLNDLRGRVQEWADDLANEYHVSCEERAGSKKPRKRETRIILISVSILITSIICERDYIMNTTNVSNSGKKSVSNKTSPVVSPLANMSVEAIKAALVAREGEERAKAREAVVVAEKSLQAAQAELAKFEPRVVRTRRGRKARKAASASEGGSGNVTRSPRAKNSAPLNQILHEIMKKSGTEHTVSDLVEVLGKTDFKTTAKKPYILVYTALKTHPAMFAKISKGTYRAI